jgi:uncharacterized protein (TIGR02996 family)
VTTEDDFRRAIDANPEDWQTLIVFSDWLRDRDDPRADGYAALARHRKSPLPQIVTEVDKEGRTAVWFSWVKVGMSRPLYQRGHATTAEEREPDALPPDWYDTVKEFNQHPDLPPFVQVFFLTRAEALDAAARGFAELPAERRAELLTGPVEEAK